MGHAAAINVGKALSKLDCFKDVAEVYLTTANYLDGVLALTAELVYKDDYPEPGIFSINLSGYDMYPSEGCVFIKDYSEHEGVAQALESAGAGRIVRQVPIGLGTGFEFELNPALRKQGSGDE